MKSSLHISASFDQPELLNNLVERLATRRNDLGYSNEPMTGEWQAVETASSEIYVNGAIAFSGVMLNEDIVINMPFITSFLFTCIKSKDQDYNLTWSISLS